MNPVYTSICAEDGSRAALGVNEAVAFYRRHHSITGHDVEWMRAAPIGVVTAAMGNRGLTIGETLLAIRELRMDGELYEPRDDHLRVT